MRHMKVIFALFIQSSLSQIINAKKSLSLIYLFLLKIKTLLKS
jgi:hypothetical protein